MTDTPRDEAIRKLQAAKGGFSKSHPDIIVAFEAGRSALVKCGAAPDEALYITRAVLRAVMDSDFVIMHRDEMQEAMLAIGYAGKVLIEADLKEKSLTVKTHEDTNAD